MKPRHFRFYFILIPAVILIFLVCCTVKNRVTNHSYSDPYWQIADPISVGVDSQVIDSIHSDIEQGKYGLIDHFLIIRHGKLIADHHYKHDYNSIAQKYDTTNFQYNYDHPDWHPYFRHTELHTLQSISKSITSMVLGIVLEQNKKIDINTKCLPFFKEYASAISDPVKQTISLEDLLTMRSGLTWDEAAYDGTDDCTKMEKTDDWIEYVLTKPMDTIPGRVFEYNSGASVLLGKLVRIISGERIDKLAEKVLFKPLGIKDYYWKTTPYGEIDSEGGLYLSSKDLAKIGQLILNMGKWDGNQIIPESWITACTSPVVPDVNPRVGTKTGYGYQWWVPKHNNGKSEIIAGRGYGGQFLMIVPKEDLVVVFNSWNIHGNPEKSTIRILEDRIIPGLKN
jgi:CubicO group peptidase (beta-lactamase class C family)